jgi:hypothetical protein
MNYKLIRNKFLYLSIILCGFNSFSAPDKEVLDKSSSLVPHSVGGAGDDSDNGSSVGEPAYERLVTGHKSRQTLRESQVSRKRYHMTLPLSEEGAPPVQRRQPTLTLDLLTPTVRRVMWSLLNRLTLEEKSAEKVLDRLRQELASASAV